MANISELKSEIRNKNAEISHLANQLGDRIEQTVDWRGAVQRDPWMTVGLCVGAGLLFSGALGGVMRFVGREAVGLGKAAIMTAITAKVAQAVAEKEARSEVRGYE